MKKLAAITLSLALAGCGNGITEWNPEPDPIAEAQTKRQQEADMRVTPQMVAAYDPREAPTNQVAPPPDKDGELARSTDSASQDEQSTPPALKASASTGGQSMPPASGYLTYPATPEPDGPSDAVRKIEAEKAREMAEATRKAVIRNSEAKLARQKAEAAAAAGNSNEADVTLPAR